jgi:hypothetical protein
MTYDLAAIERAAKAATLDDGKWKADEFRVDDWRVREPDDDGGCWWICEAVNKDIALHIAQMCPDCALALVAALREFAERCDCPGRATWLAEHGLTDSAAGPQP